MLSLVMDNDSASHDDEQCAKTMTFLILAVRSQYFPQSWLPMPAFVPFLKGI